MNVNKLASVPEAHGALRALADGSAAQPPSHITVRIQFAHVAALQEEQAAGRSSGAGEDDVVTPPVEVDWAIVCMVPWLYAQVIKHGVGVGTSPPALLPAQVTESAWAMVQEYCSYHSVQGRSDKERRQFDDRFSRQATSLLCEITSAAYALELTPLVDLGSRSIAKLIEGRSPEQIRETFGLVDDLTEEEKLDPIPGKGDRIRLLNRVNEKRRKALLAKRAADEAQAGPVGPEAEGTAPSSASPRTDKPKDDRSIDELLSFIEDANPNGASRGKGKKKAKKKAAAVEQGGGNGATATIPAAHSGVVAASAPTPPPGHSPATRPVLLPMGVPHVSLLDDFYGSEHDSEDDSDEEALDLDPLRAYFAALALQRRHAPITTLTSLAAFKGARRQPTSDDTGTEVANSGSSSTATSTIGSPTEQPHVLAPAEVQIITQRDQCVQEAQEGRQPSNDAAALRELLTALLQDCGLDSALEVVQRQTPGSRAGGSNAGSVTRTLVLPGSAGSVEVRWKPHQQ